MKSLMQWMDLPAEAADWMARIESVKQLIVAHRDHGELHGRTHPEVMARMFELGFSRLSVSRAFGGQQVDMRVTACILQTLAELDPSLSWQVMVQVAMGRLADYLPESTAHDLYSRSNGFIVGAIHAAGEAIEVEGGYRVSGRWGFASGSPYADWLVCTAQVRQEVPDGSEPRVLMFWVPVSECRIDETWDTLGMRGTGSNHFECSNVWVPADRCVDAQSLKQAPPARPSLAYQVGYYDFGTLAAMGTVLGTATGALEYFRDHRMVPQDPAVEHLVNEKVGIVVSRLHAAQLLFDDAIASARRADGDGLNVRVALAAAMLNEYSVEAVNQLHQLAGSRAVYKGHMLERYLRDVHVGSKHFVLSSLNLFGVGTLYLGRSASARLY